jgi:hypothetical protein
MTLPGPSRRIIVVPIEVPARPQLERASEPQPFARQALARRGLKPATARKARGRLLADWELVRDEGGWRPADPLFAAWVAEGRRGDPIP